MIYFAITSRSLDGLALAANSDSPQMSEFPGLEDMYRKMKLLSRISAKFQDRCTLPGDSYVIYFITAQDLSYFVLCDTTYPRVLAFSFLTDLQREFLRFYDRKKIMSVQRPYALIDFDVVLQKLKHRYNNPRSLSSQINFQLLSEELRLRPPYVLCDEELRPGYGQMQDNKRKTTTASVYNRYLPLHMLGMLSLALSCLCALLNFTRGVHMMNDTHSHIDSSFDSGHVQTCVTFFIGCFLSLYQAFLIFYPLKQQRPLACATLGSLCLCQLYLWEHRSLSGLMFHVTVACYGTFVIFSRKLEAKLPQYTL